MCRRLPTRLLALALVAVSCHTIAGTPAGNLDPTFGAEHTGIVRRGFDLDATHPYEWDDFGLGLVVDGAGRLLMAGVAQAEDDDCLGLMRFTADGRVDPAYGTNGKTCLPMDPGFEAWFLGGLRIAVGPDGGSYVAGILEFDDGTALVVCRLDAQGGPVTSFGTQNTGCTAVPGIKLLFASAIPPPLVAGDVLFLIADTIFDDGYGPAVTRLDAASGAVIPFGSDQNVPLIPVTTSYSQMLDATMTSDGRIVVVGGLEDETENLDALVVAFDPGTGTLDTDFDGDGMLTVPVDGVESGRNYATSVSLQDDDTLLVAGPYETAAASGIAVVRIDAGTGVLDTSHGEPVIKYDPCADTPQGCDLQVKRATITDSGRIALGGDVGEGEDRRMFAARLLSDGHARQRLRIATGHPLPRRCRARPSICLRHGRPGRPHRARRHGEALAGRLRRQHVPAGVACRLCNGSARRRIDLQGSVRTVKRWQAPVVRNVADGGRAVATPGFDRISILPLPMHACIPSDAMGVASRRGPMIDFVLRMLLAALFCFPLQALATAGTSAPATGMAVAKTLPTSGSSDAIGVSAKHETIGVLALPSWDNEEDASSPTCDGQTLHPCWYKPCGYKIPFTYCIQCPNQPSCCNKKKIPNT